MLVEEGEALVGKRSAEAILRSLRESFPLVVLKRGERGAMASCGTTHVSVEALPVNVVDTTGAGDAFNGGLAVALAEGKTLEDAIRFANATAALCVTRPGTSTSMPQRAEVDALLR